MEESRQREAEEETDGGDAAEKKARAWTEGTEDGVNHDLMAWLLTDETDESVADIMKLLEEPSTSKAGKNNEIEGAAWSETFRVRFIEDPYATSVVFQSSSAYVTINGNEETCGSSFSDSDASVMASIDVRGLVGLAVEGSGYGKLGNGWLVGEGGGAWGSSEVEASGWVLEDSDVFDLGMESDDDLLAKFLGQDCL